MTEFDTLQTFQLWMYLYLEIVLSLKNADSFLGALEIKESMQEVISKNNKNIWRQGLIIKQIHLLLLSP